MQVSRVVDDRRPSEMFLFIFIARRYQPVGVRGELLAKAAPFARVEPFR